MLVGFLLLLCANGSDCGKTLPVTDDIYQTEEQCQTVLEKLHKHRPTAVFVCGEVYSEDTDGSDY